MVHLGHSLCHISCNLHVVLSSCLLVLLVSEVNINKNNKCVFFKIDAAHKATSRRNKWWINQRNANQWMQWPWIEISFREECHSNTSYTQIYSRCLRSIVSCECSVYVFAPDWMLHSCLTRHCREYDYCHNLRYCHKLRYCREYYYNQKLRYCHKLWTTVWVIRDIRESVWFPVNHEIVQRFITGHHNIAL